MNKWLKFIFIIIEIIIICLIIDLISIFTINKPLFAVKGSLPYQYSGLFFNTYNCPEYSIPQIKAKGTKFACSESRINLGKVIEIEDITKTMINFSCAEVLEEFYQDENYTYYYNCAKSKYVIVRYENGYEETVKNALNYQTITIDDLDLYHIDYIKLSKN